MYAVIRTGGKQYRVQADDIIAIEHLAGGAGDKITFDEVLILGENGKAPTIGTPRVNGAAVSAEIIEQAHADKIKVVKFKRRKRYQRVRGHRQEQTFLKITDISTKTASTKTSAKTKPAAKKAPSKTAKTVKETKE